MGDGSIEVRLLGGSEARRDGVALPPFPRRDAAALVKLLGATATTAALRHPPRVEGTSPCDR
jgi:hypothetical protein